MDRYIMRRKIKKLVIVLLIAAFISGLVPGSIFNQVPTASAAVPSVQAKAYVVMDANSGGVIYKKSMNKKIYPASTVKLMTAIVALENADLDKKITFTKKLRKMIPSDASKLGLKAGTTYSVRQYLNMMLIASDADSATALASGTAGTYENFITHIMPLKDLLLLLLQLLYHTYSCPPANNIWYSRYDILFLYN